MVTTEGSEVFEYDSGDYSEHYYGNKNGHTQPTELIPTFVDSFSEDTVEDTEANLVVNLEDLVNEENYINNISQTMKIPNKNKVYQLCEKWWA